MNPVTSDSFDDQVRRSALPVLVDFWAPWCTRCAGMEPAVREVATTFAGRGSVVTVDVEAHPELAAEHLVLSLPAVAFYRDGAVVRTLAGPRSAEELAAAFEEVLDGQH
ncbi:MAG: thiol reductase thioredoxin [Nocardioidaceae bacterium]|nr:thiol reductase thioredoxin [Nocardioidaceae bacterium]